MILTDEEIKAIDPDGLSEGFARAIEAAVLSKLAEQDVEPVARVNVVGGVCDSTVSSNFSHIQDGQYYLHTNTQLLAAQQRTAEACAKVCEVTADKYQETESRLWPECRSDAQSGASSCEGSIRNGEWREYL